jgi:hypothetical protein
LGHKRSVSASNRVRCWHRGSYWCRMRRGLCPSAGDPFGQDLTHASAIGLLAGYAADSPKPAAPKKPGRGSSSQPPNAIGVIIGRDKKGPKPQRAMVAEGAPPVFDRPWLEAGLRRRGGSASDLACGARAVGHSERVSRALVCGSQSRTTGCKGGICASTW